MPAAQQTFPLVGPARVNGTAVVTSTPVAATAAPPRSTEDGAASPTKARPKPAAKAPTARKGKATGTAGTAKRSTSPRRRPAPVVTRWERFVVTVGIMGVRLAAAVVSYEHMRSLAAEAGEGWRSVLLPVSVDGLAVVALVSIRLRARAGEATNWFAWLALGLSLAASLGANVAAAAPTAAGRLVAAWPPVALGLAEVVNQHRPAVPASTHVAAPVPSDPTPKARRRRA